jgi:hemolysin-activating ACP:hemolysin acyltransferase
MDKVFLEALWLWVATDPYSSYPCETIKNRLIPAFHFNKVRPYYAEDGSICAIATWGFMMREEYDTRVYLGWDVFSRLDGDLLVVVDMIAPDGKNDVLMVTRDLRQHFWALYPQHERVYAHRGPRNGVFPNKGG